MAPTWLVAWLGTALDITPDFLFLLFFLAYACALALLAPSYSRMLPIRGTLYSMCSVQSWLSAVPDLVPLGWKPEEEHVSIGLLITGLAVSDGGPFRGWHDMHDLLFFLDPFSQLIAQWTLCSFWCPFSVGFSVELLVVHIFVICYSLVRLLPCS